MRWNPYIVRAGDHLDQLAARLGFRADQVWNDSRNASLRALRSDPRMLAPGDVLYVPRAAPSDARYAHQSETRFVARAPATRVKVRLCDASGPIASAQCKVQMPDGETRSITTTSDGTLAFEVPVETREVMVLVEALGVELKLCPGQLDPIDTARGVRQRLQNLGHYPLTLDGDALASASDDDHRAAIRSFRHAHRLSDGEHVDEAFTRELTHKHGV